MLNYIISNYFWITHDKFDLEIELATDPLLLDTSNNRLVSILVWAILGINVRRSEDAVIFSSFVRLSFLIYCLYYGESLQNIIYGLYLVCTSFIEWNLVNSTSIYYYHANVYYKGLANNFMRSMILPLVVHQCITQGFTWNIDVIWIIIATIVSGIRVYI
jgi:hypothetical protein